MKKITLILALLATFTYCHAQYFELSEDEASYADLGFGLGLGYGGIGGRLTAWPAKPVGLFAGVGYNLNSAGWNLGGILRVLPDKKVRPILVAMYGYNGVIVIVDAPEKNKTYYGASFGGGIELHQRNGQNYFNFELIFPVRKQQFHDDIRSLSNSGISISEPPPFTIGIGYHFKF